MDLKKLLHIYLGSSLCGPYEAFNNLCSKNILFEPAYRHPTLSMRFAARKVDWVLSDACGRLAPIAIETVLKRLEDPRADGVADLEILKAGVAYIDCAVFDMVYPAVGALALLRSSSKRDVSSDEDIVSLLSAARKLIEKMEIPKVKEVAQARHVRMERAISMRASFGFYCLMSIQHSKADHYPFRAFNDVIEKHFFTIVLSLPLSEQREVFQIVGYSEDEIVKLYIQQARLLAKETAGDLLKVGFMESLEQFADFVEKGKELKIFTGWDRTDKNEAGRDVCVNLENPAVLKMAQGENWKLPERYKNIAQDRVNLS